MCKEQLLDITPSVYHDLVILTSMLFLMSHVIAHIVRLIREYLWLLTTACNYDLPGNCYNDLMVDVHVYMCTDLMIDLYACE